MKKFILLVLIICMTNKSFGQTVFQIFQKNVGLIEYSYSDSLTHKSIGTGTILFKPLDGRKNFGYDFIITNKHVLPTFTQSRTVEFSIANPDSSNTPFTKITIPIFQPDGKYDVHVLVSNDEDLAVIEISKLIGSTEKNSKHDRIIYYNLLATKDTLRKRNISIGDNVFFIGYPSFFYEKNNISPVLRTGYIATDPLKPYFFNTYLKTYFGRDVLNGFLIDANVFGGSSGSLVCLYPTLTNQLSDGHLELQTTKSDPWILGILTESYYDIGTKQAYSQRVNIGGVISSDKILELINRYSYRNP